MVIKVINVTVIASSGFLPSNILPVLQVAAIQRLGLRTAMLTGDCGGAAAAVAAAVGIQPADVHADLMPADKLTQVRRGRRPKPYSQ